MTSENGPVDSGDGDGNADPIERNFSWRSRSNIQGHPEGLSDACHENTASTGMELPSPVSESLAGQGIGQPRQRGELASPGFNSRSRKINAKREDHYLDGITASQRLQHPIMAPTPTSSIAVNTVLQDPTSTGVASVLPKHHSATCPLDQILLDFISSRRALAAKSFAMNAVIGPTQPCLQAVFNPLVAAGVQPTSRVLTEVLSTFGHVALPEKLAFMFVMFRTMRVCVILSVTNCARPI